MLNINGDLIGINTAIYAKAQGIGFAIPISKARKIISDLITHGEVIEAWIGIIVQNIDAGLARYMGLQDISGVLVKSVESGSPAAKTGVREGDVIVALENRKISTDDDYQAVMRSHSVGDISEPENLAQWPITETLCPGDVVSDGTSQKPWLPAPGFAG